MTDEAAADHHDGQQFDRLPAEAAERDRPAQPTRTEVLSFFAERFGIPPSRFTGYTFWEKGRGKVWAFRGDAPSPIAVEALGLMVLRTRQEHWKPTTDAIQVFGPAARDNVIVLDRPTARAFWNGADQPVSWAGDWGYLIVAVSLVGREVPIGVGLYLDDELRSVIPKSRREEIPPAVDEGEAE